VKTYGHVPPLDINSKMTINEISIRIQTIMMVMNDLPSLSYVELPSPP
jgi:hypothetical protein